MPLYRTVLGPSWDRLPQQLQTMHSPGEQLLARGRASVERGRGVIARLLAAVIGFPPAAADVEVQVDFRVEHDVERWQRNFGGRRFVSYQYRKKDQPEGLLLERFGPFAFVLALEFDGTRLHLIVRGWRFLGLPLPAWLAPGGETYEHVQDGRFCFHVEIAHPWFGLIVRYRGWLEPS